MTIDDESSIYVGGLPYDATEDTIRTVFDLYGAILDVKIINDVRTRGKCYCFVTFTNPRSAIDAINDMNGRTIDGRVVKVNGVRTRGGRSNFGRELIQHDHDTNRNGDWDCSRDRDRDYNHDKDRHRNQNSDWSRERDRSREHDRSGDFEHEGDRRYEHAHYHDLEREPFHVKDRSQESDEQEHSKALGQATQRDYNLDYDTDKKMDRTYDPDRSFDGDRNEHSRRNNGFTKQPNMDFSLDSNGYHNDEIADQLDRSTQRLGQLKSEVSQLEEKLQEKRHLVMDLQKQSRKLEDALINAKKRSSYRQMQLTKLHKCFLQVKDYTERLKTCEKELQTMVDTAMLESDGDGEAVGLKDLQMISGYV